MTNQTYRATELSDDEFDALINQLERQPSTAWIVSLFGVLTILALVDRLVL